MTEEYDWRQLAIETRPIEYKYKIKKDERQDKDTIKIKTRQRHDKDRTDKTKRTTGK